MLLYATSVQALPVETYILSLSRPCDVHTSMVRECDGVELSANAQYTVPASSDRMLAKSLTMDVSPDIFIYDLEDSVPPSAHDKNSARKRLCDFLDVCPIYTTTSRSS